LTLWWCKKTRVHQGLRKSIWGDCGRCGGF